MLVTHYLIEGFRLKIHPREFFATTEVSFDQLSKRDQIRISAIIFSKQIRVSIKSTSFRSKLEFRLNQLLYEKSKQLIRPLRIPQAVIETYHQTIKYESAIDFSKKSKFPSIQDLAIYTKFDYRISKEENTYLPIFT